MAATFVGGSVLSAFLQVLFDRVASPEVLAFFRTRKLNNGQLKKLKIMMESVEALLDDAEEKQITKFGVKVWLDELKDALYEADDLLDEIVYEAHRLKLEGLHQTITHQVRNFFSFSDPFSDEMGGVLDRLEYLVGKRDFLGLNLKENTRERQSKQKLQTTSVVDEYGFYGRDGEKGTLIELLLSDDPNGSCLSVIPIVGMSGIGKTTLAQHVFNDSRVQDWFDLKAWVCVSGEFDVLKVIKDIFEEVASKASEANTLNKLQVELKLRLKGKKVLLVLDDVWNDKYDPWEMLIKPLGTSARGSKIVITTRSQNVASVTCTVPGIHLKELTEKDCWLLFAEHAFKNRNSGSSSTLMEEIGEKIVRKCKGLPLAAKALGSLLRSKGNIKEWEKVLQSSIWDVSNDDIIPALRLSYHCLPSHLKRCFAYCAIFPKDYHIRKEKLICFWMAEGFLGHSKGNKDLMEIGEEYFDELVSMSFFQKSNRIPQYFVMHDLFNDLAKFVFGEFCHRLEDDNNSRITSRTRHLSYLRTSFDSTERFKALHNAKLLRAFIPVSLLRYWVHAGIEEIDRKVVNELLPMLRRLRVLSLSHYYNVVEIPDLIGQLKHLRYLSLTDTPIKRLPESVTSLYNLQTLILKRCRYLVELPSGIVKLVNLCYLDITETSLKEMPLQLGSLTKLWKLTDFFLGDRSGSGVAELGELQLLRGKFRLWNLQNLVESRDCLKADLNGKKQLQEIQFKWDGDTCDSIHDRDVLENLKPHSNIESLLIVGYGGTRFADWLGDSSFINISSLKLTACKYCSSLPPLGQLVSLKVLVIKDFDAIVTIGSEFYGDSNNTEKPFPSLEILRLERMPNLHEWFTNGEAFAVLRKLSILKCPNLARSLPGFLPLLTTLEIVGCQKLQTSLPRAPMVNSIKFVDESRQLWLSKATFGFQRLKVEKFTINPPDSLLTRIADSSVSFGEIMIKSCDSFKCFPLELFPRLQMLNIKGCPNMESLSKSGLSGEFRSLQSLEIIDCPKLEHFPSGGLSAADLTRLIFRDCFKLKSLPENMHRLLPSLTDLRLFHCEELVSFPAGGLPSRLQVLWVHYCNKLISNSNQWNLQKLSSLSEFLIGTLIDIESFPEETLLPSGLTSLTLSSCRNLKSLNHNGLQRLTSLRELTIKNCPGLTELTLVPSIVKLVIFNCQGLESFPASSLPSNLESLVVQCCLKLIASRLQWGLERLVSLSNLTIGKDENIESFPEETLLPRTLTSLKIKELKNLKSLNYKGIQHLNSLSNLKIKKCKKLSALPDEGLPPSVTSLKISGCSSLKDRCQRGTGEDWSKICHISSIEIDGVSITED